MARAAQQAVRPDAVDPRIGPAATAVKRVGQELAVLPNISIPCPESVPELN
nr:hypothetical protein [Gammaproteobacteria bacterium]